ncbi:MAG: hypothetical protein IKI63_06155 [Clostridia bacterium]|nr:hypothetical protein [Clostridia bacterium]
MNKSNPLLDPARIRQSGSAAAAGLALGTVVYFILFCLRNFFNSDYADSMIWAQSMAEGGMPFHPDYTYACLLPFGGNLIFLPFYWMFGMSMTTEICGMLLFAALFSASLLFLCRSLGWSWSWSTLTLAILLGVLCSTVKLREIFFGHIIYYSLGALFWFVGLGLLLRIEACQTENPAAPSKKEPWLLGATALWFLLCATNRTQAFATFVIPVLAAEALLLPAAPKGGSLLSFERTRWIRGLLVSVLAAGLGYLLGSLLTSGLVAPYENAFSSFSPQNEWADHARALLPAWIELVSGHTADGGMALASGEGLLNIIRIGVSLLLLALPVIAWFFFPKFGRGEKRLLILHWVLFALVAFAYIFGLLYNANWRLSPVVVSATVVSVAFIRFLWRQYRPRRIAACLLIGVVAFAGLGLASTLRIEPSPEHASREVRLAAYLQEQGLTYGYATFWNAGAVTVLTDSDVTVRSVEITQDGDLVPYIYNASATWYSGQGADERYFVLLSDSEFAQLNDETRERFEGGDADRWNEFWLFRLPADLYPTR